MIHVSLAPRRAIPWRRKVDPLWLLFGNADDGVIGDRKRNPAQIDTWRTRLAWWLRNPLHNLTWYLLGVADRRRDVWGPWGDEFHRPGGGWLWSIVLAAPDLARLLPGLALLVAGGISGLPALADAGALLAWAGAGLPLPYVSYLGRWKLYAGWRPTGAFGFKAQRNR
jgi:hypothetical protein